MIGPGQHHAAVRDVCQDRIFYESSDGPGTAAGQQSVRPGGPGEQPIVTVPGFAV
jgi:hypothetical protein